MRRFILLLSSLLISYFPLGNIFITALTVWSWNQPINYIKEELLSDIWIILPEPVMANTFFNMKGFSESPQTIFILYFH
jgi:hypothetical protein